MKIVICGSSAFKEKMLEYKARLEKEGHEAEIPALDRFPEKDAYWVCSYNRTMIRWSDRIDVLWDQRTNGTLFDFGMVFMAEKPLHIEYMQEKTWRGLMEQYEDRTSR